MFARDALIYRYRPWVWLRTHLTYHITGHILRISIDRVYIYTYTSRSVVRFLLFIRYKRGWGFDEIFIGKINATTTVWCGMNHRAKLYLLSGV